jgi:hypothetical protein
MNPTAQSANASGVTLGPWDRFWFTPADPTTLGLIRIFCGLVVVYVHLAYIPDLQEFFGAGAWFDLRLADAHRQEMPWVAPGAGWAEPPVAKPLPEDVAERMRTVQYIQRWGIDPRVATGKGTIGWSVWYHLTDSFWMNVVHGGVLVVLVLFTLGLWTRVTSVLAWLAALCYVQRSPVTLFGQDAIMMILLLYLMIGPSGAALSLDQWLARRRGASAWPAPSVSANVALRLMQVHFCIIYLAAGTSKLLGGAWWNGTALWGTLANYEFAPLRFTAYAEALRWLCQHRWLWEAVMSAGSLFTLGLELGLPFLVWYPRLRGPMVVGAVLLHTLIAVSMGLVTFGLLMLALVLSFVPAAAVNRLLARREAAQPETGPLLAGADRTRHAA